jgi:hypothetical protein
MGMYTQLCYNAALKENTPDIVVNILYFMTGEREFVTELPNHPLFETSRWRVMLRMNSAYFAADTHSKLFVRYGDYYLNIMCNLKNYDNEIEKFIAWLEPYVEEGFLGYYLYEESDIPTLIYKKE